MAKTYNTFTNVSTGDVLTATNFNNVLTNIAGYRVPPAIQVVRTTAINPYTSSTDIAWSSATYDTESPSDPMWSSGATVTIRTTGVYAVSLMLDVRNTLTMTGVNLEMRRAGATLVYMSIPDVANPRIIFSTTQSLTAADALTFRLNFAGGGTTQINGAASGADQSRLNITWLGQVS